MDYCKRGHPLDETNLVYRQKAGRTIPECRQCRRETYERWKLRRKGAGRSPNGPALQEPPVTPEQAVNSVVGRGGDGTRRPYLVGSMPDATRWLLANGYLWTAVSFVRFPHQLKGLDPAQTRIVLLPSYPELDMFWLLQVEVRLLERLGATVEKA